MKKILTTFLLLAFVFSADARRIHHGSADGADYWSTASLSDETGKVRTDQLARWVHGLGLWDYFRIYLMKSTQNAGTGSTVYGMGGLTINNMTLVYSPSWGSDGITLDGSTQYGYVADFIGGGSLTIFSRFLMSTTSPANPSALITQYDSIADARSFIFDVQGNVSGDPCRIVTSADGTGFTVATVTAPSAQLDEDQTVVTSISSGSTDVFLWRNKTNLTESGAGNSNRYNAGGNILFGAMVAASPTNHFGGTKVADCIVVVTLTTVQRETITDVINAL
jgi:hypothetical protein